MALEDIFSVAGSALNAQTTRMNTTASNLANAATVAGSEEGAFRAKRAIFKVEKLIDDPSPIRKMSEPGNPLADKDGYIYLSNVNEMTEMVEMMAASRSYQNNVEVVNTTRQLMMRTIDIIKN